MKSINSIIAIILMALIFVTLWGLYNITLAVIDIFAELDPKYGAALVAASATVIVSAISVVVSRHLENRATIRKELREKKAPVYEDLISFMVNIITSPKTGEKVTEKDVTQFMVSFTQRAMIWAADDVINAWVKFQKFLTSEGADQKGLLLVYENIIREIRNDLGHKSKKLPEGTIMSTIVSDIEIPKK